MAVYLSRMAESDNRDLNRFIVRMPDGMRERIRQLAETNGRSMNAEIVHRLEMSLDSPPTPPTIDFLARRIFKTLPTLKRPVDSSAFSALLATYERLSAEETRLTSEFLRAAMDTLFPQSIEEKAESERILSALKEAGHIAEN